MVEVARSLGLNEVTTHPRVSLGPCPACGQQRRHRKTDDKRGAIGVTPNGLGWRCFQCDAGGNARDLAGYTRLGDQYRPRARSARRDRAVRSAPAVQVKGPDPAELAVLWRDALPVTADARIRAYLTGRRIDADYVACGDLARALPRSAQVPQWIGFKRRSGTWISWPSVGRRLLLRLYDHAGNVASISLARESQDLGGAKSWSPRRTGCVLADGLGVQLLATGALPEWWDGGPQLTVVITEGDVDFLSWATQRHYQGEPYGPAVFGIFSGSWTREFAGRVPDSAKVVIATDADEQGDKFAATIVKTFVGRRIAFERWRPPT